MAEDVVQFSVRLPAAVHKRLRDRAYREETSFQQIVLSALSAYMAEPAAGGAGLGAAMGEHLTIEEMGRLAVALDLLRNAPPDLRRILIGTLQHWEKSRPR